MAETEQTVHEVEALARRPRGTLRARIAIAVAFFAAVVTLSAPSVGATPQYDLMVSHKQAGVPLGCADLRWAAGQGLIDPVEVHFLAAIGISCPNTQYIVMLVLGSKGQLTCADVQWNAAYGFITWSQALDLLWRVPGCQLTDYQRLVTLLDEGPLTCLDVNWHEGQGLIEPVQAGWLRDALVARGIACAPPAPPPPTAPPPMPGVIYVGFPVTAGAFCATADAGKHGYTAGGTEMVCSTTVADSKYRWRAA